MTIWPTPVSWTGITTLPSSFPVRRTRTTLHRTDANPAIGNVDVEKNSVRTNAPPEAIAIVLGESLEVSAEGIRAHRAKRRVDPIEIVRRQPIELPLSGLVENDDPGGRSARRGTGHTVRFHRARRRR